MHLNLLANGHVELDSCLRHDSRQVDQAECAWRASGPGHKHVRLVCCRYTTGALTFALGLWCAGFIPGSTSDGIEYASVLAKFLESYAVFFLASPIVFTRLSK